jgi:hypothetical protein
MDAIRETIVRGLSLNEDFVESRSASRLTLRPDEEEAVSDLRESTLFASLKDASLDYHSLRAYLSSVSSQPITTCENAARKLVRALEANLLTESFEISGKPVLIEGLASAETPDEEHGVYGVGDGADKPSPKGDADKGASQKGEHGDDSKTAAKGYMDEMEEPEDDEDKEKKVKEKKVKEKDDEDDDYDSSMKEDKDDNDDDYDSMKDEKKESVKEEDAKGTTSADPKQSAPGVGSATTSGDKPETPDADTPDYSRVEKVGGDIDVDQGRGPIDGQSTMEGLEEEVIRMMAESGIHPGSPGWVENYLQGMHCALEERAALLEREMVNALKEQEQEVEVPA